MPISGNFLDGGGGPRFVLGSTTGIKTLAAHEKVYIKWTDPDDVLSESGAALGAWGGTLLVRKAGSAPKSRADGVIVIDSKTRDAYKNTYFCDTGLSNGVTYYYRLFPYTTEQVYTSNEDNIFSATPNTVPIGDVTSVRGSGSGGYIDLYWYDPYDVSEDGVKLAEWEKTIVVYNTSGFPKTPDDGVTLLVSTTRYSPGSPLPLSRFEGFDVDVTYYFTLFPCTKDGYVNMSGNNSVAVTPVRTKVSTPTVTSDLTYNGREQSPKLKYTSSAMTVSGTTSATNAGSYTIIFTLGDAYCWSDGSTSPLSVTWEIAKAKGFCGLTSQTFEFSEIDEKKYYSGSAASGNITWVPGTNDCVVIGWMFGNSFVFSAKGEGTVTVSFYAEETENYTQSDTVEMTFIVTLVGPLNDTSWADISEKSSDGTAANYWAVGDTKQITLNGYIGNTYFNFSTYVFILGFNHNAALEGSNMIHFQLGKSALTGGNNIALIDSMYYQVATTSGYFNYNCTYDASGVVGSTDGGWASCNLRNTIVGTALSQSNCFISALPSDLKSVLKKVVKYTDNVGAGTTNQADRVTSTAEYAFLLSPYEIFASVGEANPSEANKQEQYAYYSAGNSTLFYKSDLSDYSDIYLRSPTASTGFACVIRGDSGQLTSDDTIYVSGIAPCFCV